MSDVGVTKGPASDSRVTDISGHCIVEYTGVAVTIVLSAFWIIIGLIRLLRRVRKRLQSRDIVLEVGINAAEPYDAAVLHPHHAGPPNDDEFAKNTPRPIPKSAPVTIYGRDYDWDEELLMHGLRRGEWRRSMHHGTDYDDA